MLAVTLSAAPATATAQKETKADAKAARKDVTADTTAAKKDAKADAKVAKKPRPKRR